MLPETELLTSPIAGGLVAFLFVGLYILLGNKL